MFNLQVILIAVCILMTLFYLLGRFSRTNGDEDAASVYYSIFFILLFVAIILLLLYFGVSFNNAREENYDNPAL